MPNKLREREFAFFNFSEGIVERHLAFSDESKVIRNIQMKLPRHIYYSTSYYSDPSAPTMREKGWNGADLIFDIDADHFPTPCREEHDFWECKKCGTKKGGSKPLQCSNCGSKELIENTWMCEKCLEYAKDQVFKLVDEFLINDFNIEMENIQIVFSGHRGYHVHVLSEEISSLSSAARREIVDYVIGRGLNPYAIGFIGTGTRFSGPSIFDKGWRGRSVKAITQYLGEVTEDKLSKLEGWSSRGSKLTYERKERIIEKLSARKPLWESWKWISLEQWLSLLKAAVEEFGAKIDEPVTTDINRLIRLPGSLHGKTGLLVQKIDYQDLSVFDPFKDPIVFSGEEKVFVSRTPAFNFGGIEYSTMENEYQTLGKAAAIYLIAQNYAKLAD
jgi:DNA primase small subunit